jgi:hypothetical protein
MLFSFMGYRTSFGALVNYLPIPIFVLIPIVAFKEWGTRGWVIIFGIHHLVVEPFDYNSIIA